MNCFFYPRTIIYKIELKFALNKLLLKKITLLKYFVSGSKQPPSAVWGNQQKWHYKQEAIPGKKQTDRERKIEKEREKEKKRER